MDGSDTLIDWALIERRLGVAGLERFAHDELRPLVENVPQERKDAKGKSRDSMDQPLTVGFVGFSVTFCVLMVVLPDNFVGVAARFILFFPLFFLWIAFGIFLYRDRFKTVLGAMKTRFVARSAALKRLAERLDLTYVPTPGGAPAALKYIAGFRFMPEEMRDLVNLLDDHGGMHDALAVAQRSGVMAAQMPAEAVDQSVQTQTESGVNIEDGFQGVRNGIALNAFEWIESGDETPDIHHLVMVFELPRRVFGVTQLRSRHIPWPGSARKAPTFTPVRLLSPAFENRFRMRTTDQVEARTLFDPAVIERVARIAKGQKLRAVAFERFLVVDVEGEDRFAMVDIKTGDWSAQRIAQTMTQIADMLDLSQALADAFRLKAAS